MNADIGIIGGSGVYALDALTGTERVHVQTPYGDPSGALVIGSLHGRSVAFIARHSDGHRIAPGNIPARANIYALKSVGVRQVISISAVGSLREDYHPGDLVVPDQIVDRTNGSRPASFFDTGIVVHVPFGDPYCERLRGTLIDAVEKATPTRVHPTGTYCCMEGPQFSTRAESNLYRSWGMDIIGMTALPEAKLAREAELCYAALALVTDYDCWRTGEESVTATTVAETMAQNVAHAQATVIQIAQTADAEPACACQSALADSIITPREAIPSVVRDRMALVIGKYLNSERRPIRTVGQAEHEPTH